MAAQYTSLLPPRLEQDSSLLLLKHQWRRNKNNNSLGAGSGRTMPLSLASIGCCSSALCSRDVQKTNPAVVLGAEQRTPRVCHRTRVSTAPGVFMYRKHLYSAEEHRTRPSCRLPTGQVASRATGNKGDTELETSTADADTLRLSGAGARLRPSEPAAAHAPNGTSPDSAVGTPTEHQQPTPEEEQQQQQQETLPTARDALNWFCISMILLISLSDFTPLGSIVTPSPSSLPSLSPSLSPSPSSSSSSSLSYLPLLLAAIQWFFFVGPTLSWAKDCRFPLLHTFKLKPCSLADVAKGAVGGLACWAVTGALISFKSGLPLPPDLNAQGAISLLSGVAASQSELSSSSIQSTLWDVLWYAASPAAAEELLFRGFALTALSSSFGRIDSIMIAAAMFGAFHLSVTQLFPTMVLGIASGFAASASGSIFPAIALHFTNNAAALLLGGAGPISPIGN